MHTGSTPVAKGSSVPVWPTLRVPRPRRTWSTTSWDAGPAGLSTTSTPSIALLVVVFGRGVGSGFRGRIGGAGRGRRPDLLEELGHAIARLQALVVLEQQLRGVAQAQALPERAAKE